ATSAHPLVADGWKVLDTEDTLRKTIPQMKKDGANFIVVLSHDNLGNNQDTIRRVRGIDVMIGGHDHQTTDRPISVQDPDGQVVPLVEAGGYGYMVGKMTINYDGSSKKIHQINSTLYPVRTYNTEPDPEINQIVHKWEDRG
ncbi:MAG: hypothetical protein ACLFQV_11865, partial [Vulcanimicrobiota bacterium]